MKQYVIDFNGVNTHWDFYNAIIDGLEFPDWCGKNPDAIWDLLTGWVEWPATISIKGINKLPKEFDSKTSKMIELLEDAQQWYKDVNQSVEFRILD